ncbi:coiled-coil domain-containing protein 34 [Chelonus insularis]|uniref:coiled-coil domain-containing protein 34 n=1 Tax=Chelonus insularis TaxID=460826 RepID=UPI001589EB7C|nr:coiled-coil domain-containing protein 34 [Chelonus insularis]
MASTEKIDSLDLNHWKLCNKDNSFVLTKTSSALLDTARIHSSKNDIFDSQISSRSSKSSQIRCINPAIYVEPLNVLKSGIYEDDFSQKKSNSVDLNTEISNTHAGSNLCSSFNTYRCGSLIPSESFKTSSSNKSKSLHTIERRCKIDDQSVNSVDCDQPEVQRYSLNGNKIIKISTSLSNCTLSQHESGNSVSKKQAYNEWIKKKKLDILRKKKEANELELQKKIDEERLKQEKEEKEKLDNHNFLVWIERKRKENMHKRMIAKKEFELKRQIEELEAKTAIAKEIYLKQWYIKKERERKAQKRNEELKMQQFAEERQKKLEESSKAFKTWREKTKNRPRPATQGLLPHQQAKPRYINPIPWVVDQGSSEINESQIINNETTPNPVKNNITKSIVQK